MKDTNNQNRERRALDEVLNQRLLLALLVVGRENNGLQSMIALNQPQRLVIVDSITQQHALPATFEVLSSSCLPHSKAVEARPTPLRPHHRTGKRRRTNHNGLLHHRTATGTIL